MIVTNWEIKEHDATFEVSAEVDGYRLWYRLPKAYRGSTWGDPFLSAALLQQCCKERN